jgi:hypothetical protein
MKGKVSQEDADRLVDLFTHRVPPGVDEAAYVKAAYLAAVAEGTEPATLVDRARAVELLGTMQVRASLSASLLSLSLSHTRTLFLPPFLPSFLPSSLPSFLLSFLFLGWLQCRSSREASLGP